MAEPPQATNIPFATPSPTPTPAVPRASPTARVISTKLISISTLPSHEELAAYQPYNTGALSRFDELLRYLISQNKFTTQDVDNAKADIARNDGLRLSVFAALFMGFERSEGFVASVPFDFFNSPDYHSPDGPTECAQNLSVGVVSPPNPDFKGNQSTHSLSFDLPARGTPFIWTIPFDAKGEPADNDINIARAH